MSKVSLYDLATECYGSLSRALNWIVTKFPERETRIEHYCDDVTGTSFTLSSLVNIFDKNYDKFNSTLAENRGKNPFDSVDAFVESFKDHLEYEVYVKNYLNILLSPLIPWQYLNHDLEKVVWGCRACSRRFECLYVFKEILSFLHPQSIKAKNSLNYRMIVSNRNEIAKILEKYLIRSTKGMGWAYNTRDRENVDPYVTARLLKFFNDWNDQIQEFRFKVDFSRDSKTFQNCLDTVKKLQEKDDLVKKFNLIDEMNVKGSWKEVQWGQFDVWRIKGASHIAEILYAIEGKKSEEIENAKSFLERAFGGRVSQSDVTIFSDSYTATVSDITGTIGLVDFYLSIGREFGVLPTSEPVISRIRWLLDEQRKSDGAWPVLSEELWKKEKGKDSAILRKRILSREDMNSNNVSICNTMLMINTLINFLQKSLT